MRSSNPRVLQVREEYFERIRQGMGDGKDSVVLVPSYRRIQEVKSEAVGPETRVTYSKREQ